MVVKTDHPPEGVVYFSSSGAHCIPATANPSSGTGAFSNTNPGIGNPPPPGGQGPFTDLYTFTLVGGSQFITIASATNVFADSSQFITASRARCSTSVRMAPSVVSVAEINDDIGIAGCRHGQQRSGCQCGGA